MNTQEPKYHQKSKAIYSAEPNHLSQFEMRYPVIGPHRKALTIKIVWAGSDIKSIG